MSEIGRVVPSDGASHAGSRTRDRTLRPPPQGLSVNRRAPARSSRIADGKKRAERVLSQGNVLYQLSYRPMVDPAGLEPATASFTAITLDIRLGRIDGWSREGDSNSQSTRSELVTFANYAISGLRVRACCRQGILLTELHGRDSNTRPPGVSPGALPITLDCRPGSTIPAFVHNSRPGTGFFAILCTRTVIGWSW